MRSSLRSLPASLKELTLQCSRCANRRVPARSATTCDGRRGGRVGRIRQVPSVAVRTGREKGRKIARLEALHQLPKGSGILHVALVLRARRGLARWGAGERRKGGRSARGRERARSAQARRGASTVGTAPSFSPRAAKIEPICECIPSESPTCSSSYHYDGRKPPKLLRERVPHRQGGGNRLRRLGRLHAACPSRSCGCTRSLREMVRATRRVGLAPATLEPRSSGRARARAACFSFVRCGRGRAGGERWGGPGRSRGVREGNEGQPSWKRTRKSVSRGEAAAEKAVLMGFRRSSRSAPSFTRAPLGQARHHPLPVCFFFLGLSSLDVSPP